MPILQEAAEYVVAVVVVPDAVGNGWLASCMLLPLMLPCS